MSDVFGRIILERKSQLLNRLKSYRVEINGVEQGRIRNGSTEEYEVPGGINEIICKINWCSSNSFSVNIKSGETVYLKTGSGIKYFWAVYSIFLIAIIWKGILKFKMTPEMNKILIGVEIILLLYFIYYLTIGRKRYLKIEEDIHNIFAK